MNLWLVLNVLACLLFVLSAGLHGQSPKQNAGTKGSAVPARKSAAPAASARPAGDGGATVSSNRSLDQRIAAVLPTEEEDRWLEIQWRTNIAAARAEAARENKPVFLWVMNGNPIGCG